MAVKKTTAGTWQVRWRDPTGRQRAKNFRTKAHAEEFERTTLVDQTRGEWVDPDRGRITLQAWADEWLAASHHLRPRSLEMYRTALGHILPVLGHVPLGKLSDTHIDRYLAAKTGELSPSTVHRHYRTLRTMLRQAVKRGRIPRSPIDAVAEPRIPAKEMRFLTATQVETLASAIDTRYRTLVLVAGWGGPRWGELAGLRAGRVDVDRNRIHIVEQVDLTGRVRSEPKTAAGRRWVGLPPSVMAELAETLDGDGLVWTSPQGAPLRHANFMRRYWNPAATRAGLAGVTPHDLRHTCVALAIADGAHPKAIQARMGHSTIQVTLDRYGHLFPDLETGLAAKLEDTRAKTLDGMRRLRVV
jgi:integrase